MQRVHTRKVSLLHVFFWFCDAVQHFQEHSDEHKGKGVFLEASLENELTPQKLVFLGSMEGLQQGFAKPDWAK